MAAELQADWVTGKTVYFLLRNSVGAIWNGATFVAYNSADYANYDIAASEQGTSGFYVGDMPAAAAGAYSVIAKNQAGGSPAETDLSVADGNVLWNGTAVWAPGVVSSLVTSALDSISANIFRRNMSNDEASAAVQSLCGAVLKLTSKFDVSGATAKTYRTNGTTVFMTQSITHDSHATPIVTLGVGA